jgi:hypothetical protein
MLVRQLVAQALAARVERSQAAGPTRSVARAILFDSPQTLLGLKPHA